MVNPRGDAPQSGVDKSQVAGGPVDVDGGNRVAPARSHKLGRMPGRHSEPHLCARTGHTPLSGEVYLGTAPGEEDYPIACLTFTAANQLCLHISQKLTSSPKVRLLIVQLGNVLGSSALEIRSATTTRRRFSYKTLPTTKSSDDCLEHR